MKNYEPEWSSPVSSTLTVVANDLTKREQFAMAAMAARVPSLSDIEFHCKIAVMYADALLAELERTK